MALDDFFFEKIGGDRFRPRLAEFKQHVEVARRPLKTPGKKSNAENVKVPATVNELLSTMQVVPGPVLPVALPL